MYFPCDSNKTTTVYNRLMAKNYFENSNCPLVLFISCLGTVVCYIRLKIVCGGTIV